MDWISDPLDSDTVIIGSGSLDLWLRATAEDTDLEVTVSEVRPDGQEVYVQSGWLRASRRALDEAASLPNRPAHTHLEADVMPVSADEFVEARVEIFPFAHAFRAGSQIRITVDAPGGRSAALGLRPDPARRRDGGESPTTAKYQSRLVLRVVPGIDVPPEPPACGALRSQPCREYQPLR